jgi:excisionase family DNA binding protein
MSDRLISVRAGADYLGIHEHTLRRLIAAGRVEAVRVGSKTIRIDPAELDRVMKPVVTTMKAAPAAAAGGS